MFAVIRAKDRICIGKMETLAEASAKAQQVAMETHEGVLVVRVQTQTRRTRSAPVERMCVLRAKGGGLVDNGQVFTRQQAIEKSEWMSVHGYARPTVEFVK